MPTTPSRARRWIKNKEATPFFKRGIFCVRLNREPSGREYQDIAVWIDTGSNRGPEDGLFRSHAYRIGGR